MYTLLTTGDVPGAATYFNPLLKQTLVPCTSGTRPSGPTEGMQVYETDTNIMRIYDGTDWRAAITYAPHVMVVRTTNVTLTTGTMTTISWSSATRNEYGMWAGGSPTLITIGVDGLYMVVHTVRFASQAVAAGQRLARIDVGGAEQIYSTVPATSNLNATNVIAQICWPMVLTAGEQIEGKAFHSAGANLDILAARMTVNMIAEV